MINTRFREELPWDNGWEVDAQSGGGTKWASII